MIDLLFASLSGGMMFLLFPKINMYLLAYFALIPLLVSIRISKSAFEAFANGFVCGFIFFSCILYWINILSHWAGPWASVSWIALSLFQALFIALFAGFAKILYDRYPKYALLAIPLLWVAIELLRSFGPYGVTGGGLGYSQSNFLPVLQLARFGQVYSIAFLIALVNTAFTGAILDRKYRELGIVGAIFICVLISGYVRIATYKDTGKPVNVAVIQANVDQDVKLDYGFALEIEMIHESLSRKAIAEKPDIIIWPETAITTYLFQSKIILNQVRQLVMDSNAYYLIGTPYRDGDRIYNSVAAFNKLGNVIGRYDKQRLVPFGEYLPLRPLFYRLLRENPLFAEDYNSNHRTDLIDLNGIKVGAVICFESTFPYIVRASVKRGAKFILVATNDAWFYDSSAIYQHLQAAKLRAVENGMYVVQAANTGISAIIDPLGRTVKSTKSGETAILLGRIFIH